MSTSPHPRGAHRPRPGVAFRVWGAPGRHRGSLPRKPTPRLFAGATAHPVAAGALSQRLAGAVPATCLYRLPRQPRQFFPRPGVRASSPPASTAPSQVVDLAHFPWTDLGVAGARTATTCRFTNFTSERSPPEGTFAGVTRRLPLLRDLGVTAVELIGRSRTSRAQRKLGVRRRRPVLPPPAVTAPPHDLQRLVDTAHGLGFGRDSRRGVQPLRAGRQLQPAPTGPYYVSTAHHTPWGTCLNFDGPESEPVREFFIQNALYWLGRLSLRRAFASTRPTPSSTTARTTSSRNWPSACTARFPDRKVVSDCRGSP